MSLLGKLEYVEVEFLAEWMGNQEGTKRTVLKSHAKMLEERDPNPVKILRDVTVVNGKIEEDEEQDKCEECGELMSDCSCDETSDEDQDATSEDDQDATSENDQDATPEEAVMTLDELLTRDRKELDIIAKSEEYNLTYHHKLGDKKLAQLIFDKYEELNK